MTRISHTHRAALPIAEAPAYVVDGTGEVQYVLLPAKQYQRVRPLLESEGFSIRDTYSHQEKVAHAAGWDDPRMAAYDNYDVHRRRS